MQLYKLLFYWLLHPCRWMEIILINFLIIQTPLEVERQIAINIEYYSYVRYISDIYCKLSTICTLLKK